MPRIYKPVGHKALCIFCSAEFVSRNNRRTYCYEEACVKARKRQEIAAGKPCTECGKPSLARNLCPTHYGYWRRSQKLYTVTCGYCGETKNVGLKGQEFCSAICNRRYQLTIARAAPRPIKKTPTDIAIRPKPRVWLGTSTSGRTWAAGPCASCGDPFIAPAGGRYCSAKCSKRAGWQRKVARVGEFTVSDAVRAAIYKRDNYTCQLCFMQVDPSIHYFDGMSATLDHIVPQSHGPKPDHSPANLRIAHRICNSRRGNKVDTIQFELIAM